MHLTIRTTVSADWKKVRDGFNETLFRALNPPFPPVKLERFDGSDEGDIVVLELNFILFRQKWVSNIVSSKESSEGFDFIDIGVQLPFFLSYWKHHHIVKSYGAESIIIDDIQFSTGYFLTDLLMYPLLYAQFLYRKPVYKKFFK